MCKITCTGLKKMIEKRNGDRNEETLVVKRRVNMKLDFDGHSEQEEEEEVIVR